MLKKVWFLLLLLILGYPARAQELHRLDEIEEEKALIRTLSPAERRERASVQVTIEPGEMTFETFEFPYLLEIRARKGAIAGIAMEKTVYALNDTRNTTEWWVTSGGFKPPRRRPKPLIVRMRPRGSDRSEERSVSCETFRRMFSGQRVTFSVISLADSTLYCFAAVECCRHGD